jgi:signal transduction histidine kinase
MNLNEVQTKTGDGHALKQEKRPSCVRAKQALNVNVALPALSGAERERLRSALHGGLGQLLTSISFLTTSLRQKLTLRNLPEVADANEILALTSRAISETQALVADNKSSELK